MIFNCRPLRSSNCELSQSISKYPLRWKGQLLHASCERKRNGSAWPGLRSSWVDLIHSLNSGAGNYRGTLPRLLLHASNPTIFVLVFVTAAWTTPFLEVLSHNATPCCLLTIPTAKTSGPAFKHAAQRFVAIRIPSEQSGCTRLVQTCREKTMPLFSGLQQ